MKYYAKHPEERPMPPKGKLYVDQVNILMNGLMGEYNVHPDTVLDLSDAEGVAGMEKIAAKIVEKEGLADMSVKDLNNALVMNNDKYMGTDLIAKGQEAVMGKKPAGPNVEKQKQKDLEEEKLDPLNTGFNLGHMKGPLV